MPCLSGFIAQGQWMVNIHSLGIHRNHPSEVDNAQNNLSPRTCTHCFISWCLKSFPLGLYHKLDFPAMFQYLIVGCYPDCIPAIDGPQGRDVFFLLGIYHNHITLYLMYLIYLMHINMCIYIYIHIHIHLPMTIPIISPWFTSHLLLSRAFRKRLPHPPRSTPSRVAIRHGFRCLRWDVGQLLTGGGATVGRHRSPVDGGYWLVVWNMNGLFFHILGIRIPTD